MRLLRNLTGWITGPRTEADTAHAHLRFTATMLGEHDPDTYRALGFVLAVGLAAEDLSEIAGNYALHGRIDWEKRSDDA